MTRRGSSTDAFAIAARGLPQFLVRFRRVDQRVKEDVPVPRRKGDLLMRLDHALSRRHRNARSNIRGDMVRPSAGADPEGIGMRVAAEITMTPIGSR